MLSNESFKRNSLRSSSPQSKLIVDDGYGNWYEDINTLGEMDGFEMVTITNNELRPYEKPCEEYLNTLKRGIRQNWSEMSEEEIDSYLESCDRTNSNSASTSSSIDDDEEDKDCE